MKKIFLSDGNYTLVSDEDFIYLVGFTWYLNDMGYAIGRVDGHMQKMHRVIAERAGINLINQIDHIDGDQLNNQRENLRSATASQNQANSKKRSDNTSGFKGVYRNHLRWQSQIKVKGQIIYLGTFGSKEEAHAAYCQAAKHHFGEYARY